MKVNAVPVRELLFPSFMGGAVLPAKSLKETLKQGHYVQFDDGVLYLTANEIIINRYAWEIFTRCRELPILKKHSINQYYVNGFYTSNSLSSVLSIIFEDVCDIYVRPNEDRSILNDYLYEAFGDIYNNIYNDVVCESLEYVTNIDIEDFLEIQVKEPILKSMLNVRNEKSEKSVKDCHNVVKDILFNDPSILHNPVRKGYVSGTFNNAQVHSILGSVGHVAELNSTIFNVPITSSYTLGLYNDYEMAIATRLAASSIYKSTNNIKTSEYSARIIQFVAMRVTNLVDGDCGSNRYLEVAIGEGINGKNDFDCFIGKRYLDEETGTLKTIRKEDTHLMFKNCGKRIKIRSPLKCNHKHTGSVCVVCMGDISYSIPYLSNLGHTCSSAISEVISQLTLSDKHHQNAAVGIDFQLAPDVRHFVKNKHSLMFDVNAFNIDKCTYQLAVTHDALQGMIGLTSSTDLKNINNNKCSKLEEVFIIIKNKRTKAEDIVPIYVAFDKKGNNNRKDVSKKTNKSKVNGYFTHAFLSYMLSKKGRYYLSDSKHGDGTQLYYININDWLESPEYNGENVIEYPVLQFNLAHIIGELKGEVNNSNKRQTPEDFLDTLHRLINGKLTVNYALLETLALAFSIRDSDDNDVHIYRDDDAVFANIKYILQNGSISGFYGYENHKNIMLNPVGFNGRNNTNHPLDGLLCPHEVMEDIKAGKRW